MSLSNLGQSQLLTTGSGRSRDLIVDAASSSFHGHPVQ